jgi:hypothetical protein
MAFTAQFPHNWPAIFQVSKGKSILGQEPVAAK